MQLIEPDDIDFESYVRETEAQQKVKPASLFVDEMLARLFTPGLERENFLPWAKARELFQFRPGEVTLWAGINGHGKSLVTGQCSLSLMGQRERVCIASFEMKPSKTVERMARQWCGQSAPKAYDDPALIQGYKDSAEAFRDWTDGKLWLYDQQGTVTPEMIVAVTRYCAKELDIRHMFIDSLMKCVRGEDDYNGQKYLVDELCAIAKDHEMHIHLVHHIKKLSSEDQMPGKFDAKGSGAITDQVDNVLIHWRNKKKEQDAQLGKPTGPEPDAVLTCAKQRNGSGWEGRIGLWYHADSQQFLGEEGQRPMFLDAWPHSHWSI